MSAFDDYEDEMLNAKFTDKDIERLLSGLTPDDEDLASMAPLVALLRNQRSQVPAEGTVVARAAGIVRAAHLEESARVVDESTQTKPRRIGLRLKPKLATAFGSLLLLASMTGVAIAADEAAPDDDLYGVDQAMEKVGIGAGGAAERLAEATALAEKGKSAEALRHAAASIGTDSDDGDATEAAEALLAAAEAVLSTDEGDADEVRQAVADMLTWMATSDVTGQDFGNGVAERAKAISTEDDDADAAEDAAEEASEADEGPEGSGPPNSVPGGPPESVSPGPPAGVGRQP